MTKPPSKPLSRPAYPDLVQVQRTVPACFPADALRRLGPDIRRVTVSQRRRYQQVAARDSRIGRGGTRAGTLLALLVGAKPLEHNPDPPYCAAAMDVWQTLALAGVDCREPTVGEIAASGDAFGESDKLSAPWAVAGARAALGLLDHGRPEYEAALVLFALRGETSYRTACDFAALGGQIAALRFARGWLIANALKPHMLPRT